MASFTFDRPLVLSEEGAVKFFEIASRPGKPDGIKPYFESEEDRKEREELLNKCFQKWKKEKMTK